MLTLLSEVHFWSVQDDISIKDTDYGAFKYNDRKDETASDNIQSKKLYTEKRGQVWNVTNKRPCKLKDKLKELEDQLSQNKMVYCKWTDNNILQIMLCTGMFISICVNIFTGDIKKISFDKFLVGKLQSGCISDVLKTRSHLLCTYNDNRLTLVHFTKKPTVRNNTPLKLSRLEARVQVCELVGPAGRRLDRKMSVNATGDRVLIWWRCARDDVYPWSPLVKDQDRANVHIYTLYGSKLELICYRRTEFDPLDVIFDVRQPNLIHCVEQKESRRGTVSVEVATYEIIRNRLNQQHVTSIPLQTHVCCHAFSPDEGQKLALGCIDGSVVLFDRSRGVTCLVKAAFIPTLASWHPNSAMLLVANERSQLQWFDLSLACVPTQTAAEDFTPGNVLDLASYFKQQPTLSQLLWNTTFNSNSDALLLLTFERGPLCILRLFEGLTPDGLISLYVRSGNIDRALNALLALDWDTNGAQCLSSLQHIVGHLFRGKFTPNVETQIQKALGGFYAPLRPISHATKVDFGDQIGDMTRKFFHSLVRHRLYEKAFCLAIDIGDHDLFMDLYHCAKHENDNEMATAALARANELLEHANSDTEDTENSLCSRSSCSQCSDSDESLNNQSETEQNWLNSNNEPTTNELLPLPPLPTITASQSNITQSVLPPPPLPYTNSLKTNTPHKKIHHLLNDKVPASPVVPLVPLLPFQSSATTLSNRSVKSHKPDLFPHNYFSSNPVSFPKFNSSAVHVHKTVSLTIPPAPSFLTTSTQPPLKVSVPLNMTATNMAASGKVSGEKNVKFSDTVTAFIVPELPRSEKPKRSLQQANNPFLTNPKQELKDSLPLCHPNDDYLKDFTPISNHLEDEETASGTTKIKVVHFGMV